MYENALLSVKLQIDHSFVAKQETKAVFLSLKQIKNLPVDRQKSLFN